MSLLAQAWRYGRWSAAISSILYSLSGKEIVVFPSFLPLAVTSVLPVVPRSADARPKKPVIVDDGKGGVLKETLQVL